MDQHQPKSIDSAVTNPLNNQYSQYWESYLKSLPHSEHPQAPNVVISYAGSKALTDKLLALYLNGTKTAGSSIVEDFTSSADPLPAVGNYWILLDSQGEPRCILRTEKVEFYKFDEVPLKVAIAEGEGDLSLDYWRKVHAEFYSPYLLSWGLARIEDATVVTEYFKIVYK